MKLVQSIYCIGIAGAGMSGLARLLKLRGKQVSGSDLVDSPITQALQAEGIMVHVLQQANHVPLDCDLYVYSDAVPETNPERAVLIQRGLGDKTVSYFTAVGALMKQYTHRIAISGTHGKTTTTAMLTMVLQEAGLDPTAIMGSMLKELHSNVRVGANQDVFIIEACEYKAHMLQLHPTTIIVSNIEEDHLDYYRDIDHIQMTFQQFVNMLPADGLFIRNADDSESRELGFDGTTVSYGLVEPADVMAIDIKKDGQKQSFKVGDTRYTLSVPGDFNIYNALAVIAYARHLGIAGKIIQAALRKFTGTWRRFEVVGEYRQATIISDYAHHPTAVTATIKAAKECYPQRRIVVVFQPHQHNRTRRLFKKFVTAFDAADLVIIQEIYDVAGREAKEDQTVSSHDIVNTIEQTGKLVLYSPDGTKTKKLLAEHIEPNDVVLIIGAGDIYRVAEELSNV